MQIELPKHTHCLWCGYKFRFWQRRAYHLISSLTKSWLISGAVSPTDKDKDDCIETLRTLLNTHTWCYFNPYKKVK